MNAGAASLRDVAAVLAAARALGVDRLDAQLLLAHRLGRARSWVLAHPEAPLADADADALLADLPLTTPPLTRPPTTPDGGPR